MPLIVANMGAEMVYILDQRLKAQTISNDKAARVLTDTVRAMFNPATLEASLKPAPVYSQRHARAVFDELAHSSIMRLNKPSMDKLYDLMTMGWKYQVLQGVGPRATLEVTTRHLETLKELLHASAEACALLDSAKARVTAALHALPAGELLSLKHTLCRFLQDRRVKVSLFVADGRGLQLQDGSIVLDGYDVLPAGTEMPGTIRYFDAGGKVMATEKVPALTALVTSTTAQPGRLPFPLGDNIYAKDKRKVKEGEEESGGGDETRSPDSDEEGEGVGGGKAGGPASGSPPPSTALLSALLRARAGGTSDADSFTPQLFAALPDSEEGQSFTVHASAAPGMESLAARLGMGATDSKEEGGGRAGGGGGGKEGDAEDDLLALLDEAGGHK